MSLTTTLTLSHSWAGSTLTSPPSRRMPDLRHRADCQHTLDHALVGADAPTNEAGYGSENGSAGLRRQLEFPEYVLRDVSERKRLEREL
ncbi:hypothetical protein [Paraburkholderia sediminicola]|uniref:hypothetical protein n=1 Tax=Paraburkholderia sediminicola TaxID=458836 RepID=UPI0038BC08B1